jgi:transposase-like protein
VVVGDPRIDRLEMLLYAVRLERDRAVRPRDLAVSHGDPSGTRRRSTGRQIAVDLKPIYRAPSREAAWAAFEEFDEKWAKPYPAIGQLWRNAWEQFVPFLDYDAEIRAVLCSTNAIESLNARYRRAVTVRGDFPTEQAAMKCLYRVTRSLDRKGTGQTRWTMR